MNVGIVEDRGALLADRPGGMLVGSRHPDKDYQAFPKRKQMQRSKRQGFSQALTIVPSLRFSNPSHIPPWTPQGSLLAGNKRMAPCRLPMAWPK
jgi:hypothetical protein